jgi:hypothetical protein
VSVAGLTLRSLRLILDELGGLGRTLHQLEQQAGIEAARRKHDTENLHGLLRRTAAIERALALTELSRPPRVSRARPLGPT